MANSGKLENDRHKGILLIGDAEKPTSAEVKAFLQIVTGIVRRVATERVENGVRR
jgi:hypothetical protein